MSYKAVLRDTDLTGSLKQNKKKHSITMKQKRCILQPHSRSHTCWKLFSNLWHAKQMSIENHDPRFSAQMTIVSSRRKVCHIQPTTMPDYSNVT